MFARNLSAIQWVAAVLAATWTVGCGYMPMPMGPVGSDNFGSSRMVQPELVPTLPPGVEARQVIVEPANSIGRVGIASRLTVTVLGSDGKSYTDPRLVQWDLSNPQMGVIDRNGVMRPDVPGTLKVTALIQGIEATATLQIEQPLYAWQQVASPVNQDLYAVEMVSRVEAWAGGDGGILLHWLNGAWRRDASFAYSDARVKGIGFANSALGWVVGERKGSQTPFVARWNGRTWQMDKLPVLSGALNAVSVLSERDVWAVGQETNGQALIMHYDGASWKAFESPVRGRLNDVQMLSPQRGWAVGGDGIPGGTPLILKFDQGRWRVNGFWGNRDTFSLSDQQELKAIKMVSDTQGYAVGTRDNLLINPRGLFLQYDPRRDGWIPGRWDTAVENLDQVPLHDIEMISGTEGWALGQIRRPDFRFERNPKSIFGNLLANVGGVLKLDTNYYSGSLSGAFYSIDLLPQGEGFVVGANGMILERTFDWRGVNTAAQDFGGGVGGGTATSNNPVTYGPGGQVIPGGQPASRR